MSEFRFNVGDEIILHEHDNDPVEGKNWDDDMVSFIGTKARVTGRRVTNYSGYYYKVDTNGWSWRERCVTSANAQNDDGCKCTKCGDWHQYASPSSTFVCYTCRNRH